MPFYWISSNNNNIIFYNSVIISNQMAKKYDHENMAMMNLMFKIEIKTME